MKPQLEIIIKLYENGGLSEEHIRLLRFFHNPTDWFTNNNSQPPSVFGSLSFVLMNAFPNLDREGIKRICQDLINNNLIEDVAIDAVMVSSGLLSNRTSEVGRAFIEYLEDE